MYKYSRKEMIEYLKDMTSEGGINGWTFKKIKDMLLATISKEEQSQSPSCSKHCTNNTAISPSSNVVECPNCHKVLPQENFTTHIDNCEKQDKPLCEHRFTGMYARCVYCNEPKQDKPVDLFYYNGNEHCPNCCILLKSPIEDTNKTSLEVPEKIKDDDWHIFYSDAQSLALDMCKDKISEILDYLTLISLDKK